MIEIDKLLIDSEYIHLLIKIYMQWSKDDGSTSSSRKLSIPRLPRFDKLDLSQLQLYIEDLKISQCFVCRNFRKTIAIQTTAVKEKVFSILHMLRIHTGLKKWSKKNIYDLHLKRINPFGIHEPCIKIAKN